MPRKKELPPSQQRARRAPVGAPAWVPELEKWEQAQYDGIKGTPPEWVSEPHRKAFPSARARLFFLVRDNKATYADIRARFDYLAQNKYGAIVLALMKDARPYDDDLRGLVRLYQAVSLGEIEGLRLLAGDDAVAGRRVRTGYKERDEWSDRPEVQGIAKGQWASDPDATVADIINSPELASYRRRYKGKHTLRTWVGAVDPRPAKAKRGRPKRRP